MGSTGVRGKAMLQVILNDVWEVVSPAEPIDWSKERGYILLVDIHHTQTGESHIGRYDAGKRIFIDAMPEFRPRELKNLADWVGRGCPR
jgi:hypothetical protein